MIVWKALIFTCEIIINTVISHVKLSVLTVSEVPVKHYTLYNNKQLLNKVE